MDSTIDNSKTQTKESQAKITPAMALKMLKEGNERFLNKKQLNRDLNAQVQETAGGQNPFAVVLGCIDSRVPAEVIFDQGIGDIFNTRIAGNFVNRDILGSLEFACKVAGSKLVVVMGHTSCGAVKGACDDVQMGNLTYMLSNLKPAVDSITDETKDRSSANPGFVQKVADSNVNLTMADIVLQSNVLKDMQEMGEIEIVGAMYDTSTGKVNFY